MKNLTPKQKTLLDSVDVGLRPQAMKLRRMLMTENMQRTTEIEGANLNTSSITDTYMSIKRNIENRDRYETFMRIPSVKCGFSFAIDFSGSMTNGRPNTWEKVLSSAFAVGKLVETMGVISSCSIVGVDNTFSSASGATDSYVPQAIMIKETNEKWTDDLLVDAWQYFPSTSTYVSQYIMVALDMVKKINAQKRVAFFLTDGEDHGVYPYLRSFVDIAKAQGIHLVGIVFSENGQTKDRYLREIPKNIIAVKDPKQLGQKMIGVLEGLFPKR
jgi:hypothetical protein